MDLILYIALSAAILVGLLAGGMAYYFFKRAGEMQRDNEKLIVQREAEEAFLHRIGACINTSLDLEPALEIITEHIMRETDAASGAVFLLDPTGQNLQARVVMGPFPPLHEAVDQMAVTDSRYVAILMKNTPITLGEGIVGFVAEKGEALLIADAKNDSRIPKPRRRRSLQISTVVLAPLKLQQKILGVIAVVNKSKESANEVFGEHDLQVLQTLADQAALTVYVVKLYEQLAERQQIEKELQVAQNFQKMLLPQTFPKIEGYDIAAFSRPALEVGGDYYDFFWVDETHLGIAIVDVSGKGIPGALVMANMRSTLRAQAEGEHSPKKVLRRVNRRMVEDTQKSTFITMIYAVLDVPNRRLRFARAGHEPLIAWNMQDSKPRVYTPEGIALGMVNDPMFDVMEECEVDLASGDNVVFFTDGAVEVMNPEREEYGLERLLSRIQDNHSPSSESQIQNILADINNFAGGIPHQDDITLVALRVREV